MSGAEERELLKWAAEAAGYTGRVEFNGSTGEFFFAFDMSEQNPRGRSTWRPRHDDGDALRLAVKLGIEIIPDREVKEVTTAFCVHHPRLLGYNTVEPFGDDEMAATCLAIVRAAAAIGKAMP